MAKVLDLRRKRLVWKDIEPSDFSRITKGLTILDSEPVPLGTPSSPVACGIVAICQTTVGNWLALEVITDFSSANTIRVRTAEISTEYLEQRHISKQLLHRLNP